MEQEMTPLALIGIIMAATLLGAFGLLSRNPEQREKAKALRLAKYKKQIRKLDNMISAYLLITCQKHLKS